jgi:hypothetical protein
MLRQRIHYWSCSKFADFIRGEKKPHALSMEEWKQWRENQEKNNKIRYYISDKLLNKIQNLILYPSDVINSLRYYFRNRFITKTHYLKTGFKPGYYYELDERILHGLFNELVDFVEVESAWMYYISRDRKDRKNKFKSRSADLGIAHLKWSMSLVYNEQDGVEKEEDLYGKPTEQAKSARELFELYNWWKNRDKRTDPYDNYKSSKDIKDLWKTEEAYDQEDEDMLIRLIKIRKHLWT